MIRKTGIKVTVVFFIVFTLTSSVLVPPARSTDRTEVPAVKNIIFMIGDGMGPSYTTAYRYFKDDPSSHDMEHTLFDRYFVGVQRTYTWDKKENITDSAAAATALATKTTLSVS